MRWINTTWWKKKNWKTSVPANCGWMTGDGDGELCLVKLKLHTDRSFYSIALFSLHFDFCKLFFAILIETDTSFSVKHLHCERLKKNKNKKSGAFSGTNVTNLRYRWMRKGFQCVKIEANIGKRQTSKPNEYDLKKKTITTSLRSFDCNINVRFMYDYRGFRSIP